MTKIISFAILQKRKEWMERLGGLPEPTVKNQEWLELLIDDGRNTMAIEGEFDRRWDLEEILKNPSYENTSTRKILNFFDAALFSYNFAYLNYREGRFDLPKSLILQLHSQMFRGIPRSFTQPPGEWAKGDRTIGNSQVKTIPPAKIDKKIDELLFFIKNLDADSTRKAAMFHAFFEVIHPFGDGNGRLGRIFLNFILISNGLPPVAIKGLSKKDRDKYYLALERADTEVVPILFEKKSWRNVSVSAFEDLLEKPLAVAMDTVICRNFELKKAPLKPISEIANKLGKNITSFSVACSQKKYISVIRKGVAMSHENLIEG